MRIQGIAVAPAGVDYIEVSTDGGQSWNKAEGTNYWTYDWQVPGEGTYSILSRAVDNSADVEVPGGGITVTIDQSLPAITSGPLNEDNVWNGSITLKGDVTIPPGVTLTIEPGTTILFEPLADDQAAGTESALGEIIVEGSLIASGTADNPIIISSASQNPTTGDWYGIRVKPVSGNTTVVLEYCTVEHGMRGIDINALTCGCSLTLKHCNVQGMSGEGVYVLGKDGASIISEIRDCNIHDNRGKGITCVPRGAATQFKADFFDNTIWGNGEAGIHIDQSETKSAVSSFSILDNIIYSNERGIYSYINTSDAELAFKGNKIYQNRSDGFYLKTAGGRHDDYVNVNTTIACNEVYENTGDGVYCETGSSYNKLLSEIRNNRIYNNSDDGIEFKTYRYYSSVSVMQALFTLNEIYGNGDRGITCYLWRGATILYNSVHDNTNESIYLEGGSISTVNFNNIYSQGESLALKNGSGSKINARFNYWGPVVTQEMEDGINPKNISAIYDAYDHEDPGIVDYAHWLSTPIILPTLPASKIIAPEDSSTFKPSVVRIQGLAVARDGIAQVEVSPDNGLTWYEAQGSETWFYEWEAPSVKGQYTVLSRAIDKSGIVESTLDGITISIDPNSPTTSGSLTANETWSGEVNLTGDVTVPAGIALAIGPGTRINFPGINDDQGTGKDPLLCELIIKGTLSAGGTEEEPILFTSGSPNPAQDNWYGIVILGGEDGSVTLSHCVVEYATSGVRVEAIDTNVILNISSSLIRQCSGDGIYIYASDRKKLSLQLNNNEIMENGGRGIYSYSRDYGTRIEGIIGDSVIHDNGSYGIYAYSEATGSYDLQIYSNTISNNKEYGIYLHPKFTQNLNCVKFLVQGNKIFSNGYGIYCNPYRSTADIEIRDNEIYQSSNGLVVDWNLVHVSNIDLHLVVAGNDVHDNTDNAIYLTTNGGYSNTQLRPNFIGNRIYRNGGNGIYCGETYHRIIIEPVITLNEIYENTGKGIYCKNVEKTIILYNDIRNNEEQALFFSIGKESAIHYNNIYNNAGDYELYLDSAMDIDARFNYWGTQTTQEIEEGGNLKNISRIYDKYDDMSKGRVNYKGWRSNLVSLPTVPTSVILSPIEESSLHVNPLRIRGLAVSPNGVEKVEISTDNGLNWHAASGKEIWTYNLEIPEDGTYTLLTRVTDITGAVETPGSGISVTMDNTLPTTYGTLAQDETWLGTVKLLGDLMIPPGVTLTVEAGSRILFPQLQDDWGGGKDKMLGALLVEGSLIAEGTQTSPILFSSDSEFPIAGDWYGIRVKTSSADSSILLQNCIVEYGVRGIEVESATPGLQCTLNASDSTVRYASQDGIYGYAFNEGEIRAALARNEIHENGNRGIYLYSNSDYRYDGGLGEYVNYPGCLYAAINGNRIYSNGNAGIICTRNEDRQAILEPVFSLNEVFTNGSVGVSCQASVPVKLFYNNIHHNTSDGVRLMAGGKSHLHFNNFSEDSGDFELKIENTASVNARFNYWGSSATQEMEGGTNPQNISRIFDLYDDSSKGLADYSNWLPEALILPEHLESRIISPINGSVLKASVLTIQGIAVSRNAVVRVEVSPDGGINWYEAQGTEWWIYNWEVPGNGEYLFLSRIIDTADEIESPGEGITVTIDNSLPTVSGMLEGDEDWSGEVVITGDVVVPAGVTLTIEPGTIVRFPLLSDDQVSGIDVGRCELIVEGSLVAVGTEANPIILTSGSANPARGDWYGIRVLSTEGERSVFLEHITVEYSLFGVKITSDHSNLSMDISNCKIRHISKDGLYVFGANNSLVSCKISGNTINNISRNGIHLSAEDQNTEFKGEVIYNIIHSCTEKGIFLEVQDTLETQSGFQVLNNEIYGCSHGLYCYVYESKMSLELASNEILQCDEGIYLITDSYETDITSLNAVIINNEIYQNGGSGVYGYADGDYRWISDARVYRPFPSSLYLEITGNRVYENGTTGIHLGRRIDSGSILEPVIIFNQVRNNWEHGIQCDASGPARVYFNNIYSNDGYAFINESPQIVDARYDYWGSEAIAQMDSSDELINIQAIYDIFDDSSKAVVNYMNWHSSQVPPPDDLVTRITYPLSGEILNTDSITVHGIAFAT